jgi:hypothetical protein
MGNRIQCRRAQHLASAQTEAGMMPRTTNRIADEEPLGKRGAVMCADGADREQFFAAPDKEHRLAVRMPEQHGSVGNRYEFNPLREVRPA